jgi:hypothetical protein
MSVRVCQIICPQTLEPRAVRSVATWTYTVEQLEQKLGAH